MRNLQDLQANGKDPFQITKYDADAHSQEIKDNFETMEGKKVSIAGRMMSKRVMGKASFCNVQGDQGNIQSYVARECVGEEAYKDFKKMDIGDIVGIKGEVFRTKINWQANPCRGSNIPCRKSLQEFFRRNATD